jgi:hypothetical protein
VTDEDDPMRVSFIVSPSYHGSTLLGLLLRNHSQISSLGDTIPRRGGTTRCTCGKRVNECEFWLTISTQLDTARFAGNSTMLPILPSPLTRHYLTGYPTRVFHNTRADRLAGRSAAIAADRIIEPLWRLRPRQTQEFANLYRSLYKLTLDLQGTSLFVDGSKNWRTARLLARTLAPAAEVNIIHLVRDPRGFAVSQRARGLGRSLRTVGWLWADLHRRIQTLEHTAPYRVLLYEDLCAQPEVELRSLFASLGLAPETVVAPPLHPAKNHLIGNKMRKSFDGNVRLDERWRTELSDAEQRTVLGYAGDLAARFGYVM